MFGHGLWRRVGALSGELFGRREVFDESLQYGRTCTQAGRGLGDSVNRPCNDVGGCMLKCLSTKWKWERP